MTKSTNKGGVAGSVERVKFAASEKAVIAIVGVLAAGGAGVGGKKGMEWISAKIDAAVATMTLQTEKLERKIDEDVLPKLNAVTLDVERLKMQGGDVIRRLDRIEHHEDTGWRREFTGMAPPKTETP